MRQAKIITDIFMAQNLRVNLCLIGEDPGLFFQKKSWPCLQAPKFFLRGFHLKLPPC